MKPIAQHPVSAEILHHPHVDAELLFVIRAKRKPPIHDSCKGVINGGFSSKSAQGTVKRKVVLRRVLGGG